MLKERCFHLKRKDTFSAGLLNVYMEMFKDCMVLDWNLGMENPRVEKI